MARSEPAQRVRLDKVREAEERRLVEAAQQDRARFVDLYQAYFDLVYTCSARRTRDRATTEDLTSEVFKRAIQNLPRFKWTGAPFASWLFRIAANLIADRAKREAKISTTFAPDDLASQKPGKDSQASLEEVERRAQLFQLVDELPEDQRRVLGLRFAEEKSIKQIAAELGRSEGAVKQLQFRALENLRKQITTEDTEKISH